MLPEIEICINCENIESVKYSVSAAFQGGADRVELCSAMHLDGLTPGNKLIIAARKAFQDRPGLLAMIRPRGGDFFYDPDTLKQMQKQVDMAAECGADGVVFGALNRSDRTVDTEAVCRLVDKAKAHNLKTTFHRAFDATPVRSKALEILADLDIDRVLTSGTAWGQQGTALDGVDTIESLLKQADNRIEIVAAGGIGPSNAAEISKILSKSGNRFSLHAYSSVLEQERTSAIKVEEMVNAARNIN